MSLINDALKRAKEMPVPPPIPDSGSDSPLRPVEDHRPTRSFNIFLPLLLPVIIALAGWFLVKGWKASRRAIANAVETRVTARETAEQKLNAAMAQARQEPLPETQTAEKTVPVSATPQASEARPRTNALPATVPPAAVSAAPAETGFPQLKLQGLFYRPGHAAVFINGKTLYVGDEISGVQVTAISKETVTVRWQGETRELTLR